MLEPPPAAPAISDAAFVCETEGVKLVCFTRSSFAVVLAYVSALTQWAEETNTLCKGERNHVMDTR